MNHLVFDFVSPLFYGFDDLFYNGGFLNYTWSWDGVGGWSWGSNGWGSDSWGSICWGSESTGVSISTIGTSIASSVWETSKSSWVETTITSISSWVETFCGGSCQYGSDDKELIHSEGFGGCVVISTTNERCVCPM